MGNIFKIIVLLFFFSFSGFCQENHNINFEHIFKNWIYLEKTSDYLKDINKLETITIKNDSIYRVFMSNVRLIISDVSSNLPKKFVVKSLELNDKNIIDNDKNLDPNNVGIVSFFYSIQCNGKMVLVFDLETGMSYRVAGFNGNDLLSLIDSLKDYHFKKEDKVLKRKIIIKKYFVEDVDLMCTYKGLISEDSFNHIKYPCLKSCLDAIVVE
ncbi:hypothetical protein [Flavobacterium cyclinae]|uniref:hypothetical protein n=1 Tax=Flavobacterium cyclinae TaxID=2895947 RepID=UPI001E3C7C10|nr:hypothetical protein [Flavobacterium cyclinae]UGS21233.1 hypothetical protein LOS86_00995 [Flavobacterium cyclinae]